MGRSRGRRSPRHAVLAVLALSLAVSLAVSLAAIVPTTAGAETALSAAAGPDDERPAEDQLAEDQAPIPAECGPPPLSGCRLTWYGKQAPTLVVWGDSHLWMMTPAVVGALRGQRVNVVLFFLGGCIPSLPDMEIYAGNACAELSVDAMTYLQQLAAEGRRYRLLVGSFWGANLNRLSYYESQERADIMRERRVFTQKYTRPLFRWLGRAGIPTDVSVQGPAAVPPAECDLGSTPFWCPVTRRDAYYKDTYVRSWLARRMSRLPEGARLVDYSNGICSATTCPAVVNGVHTWFDAYHVSATKAAALSSYYRPTVRALLRRR